MDEEAEKILFPGKFIKKKKPKKEEKKDVYIRRFYIFRLTRPPVHRIKKKMGVFFSFI